MEQIAPPDYAESWDNVGLLVGAADWPAERIMLTIDCTAAVLEEAKREGAQMIVAYHPAIFQPLERLDDSNPKQQLVLRAARQGIAIYSPHTALDAAPGGVNDWLVGGLGEADIRALRSHRSLPGTEQFKLVTFCPEEAVDAVRSGLSSVGVGQIGAYTQCSFELRGQGTFFGGESSTPAVGEKGRLERVDEIRLEMVCPGASLPLAMTMLRQAHPYEEPPIEIYQLQPRPMRDTGAGRRAVLDQPVPIEELAQRVKVRLGVERVRVAEPQQDRRETYRNIGVCVGAGGSLADDAIAQGCHVFITGEMRHHSVLNAQARGCAVILAGHTNTERGYLPQLKSRMIEALPQRTVLIATEDGDPLGVM